jgi:alpha-L-glutamate ligase-like protein
MMPGIAKRLRQAGVLGLNQRNNRYTLVHNPRHLYPLVDDKLRTKQLALKAGLAVPELYGVVEIEHQVEELPGLLKDYPDFVIKPAQGSGGDGVLVVTGRSKQMYRLANGLLMDQAELEYYVSNILSGLFSLGGHSDKALIEYRVQFDPLFAAISFQGVPDVRIVVFLGVPVMAMVRLPTRLSNGKANLHQGAIGAGIDIATGATLTAVWHNQVVTEHPDTGNPVTNLRIPGWDKLLRIAAQSYELTGMGYVGVDLVLDRDKGPLILELNARPGLNIQIANRAGLLPRLKLVEERREPSWSIDDRVEFAKANFVAEAA